MARWNPDLGLTPPGYDLPPRSGLGSRQEGMPGGAMECGPGADAARLRSAAPFGARVLKSRPRPTGAGSRLVFGF